jgi:hypothetical protein
VKVIEGLAKGTIYEVQIVNNGLIILPGVAVIDRTWEKRRVPANLHSGAVFLFSTPTIRNTFSQ